jgi:SAM-dependent methyltransferase
LALAEALLPEAAARSPAWSRDLCPHADHRGHDCTDYHGIWPFILWFGLATPPQRQKEFYGAALGDAVRAGTRRILVSGAADYNLPATAFWACLAAGIVPELNLLDVCPTPLRLSSWFAERAGLPIETVAGDILDHRAPHPYDAIVVHSFLGHFRPDRWNRLIRAWGDQLAPGGRVILVNRLRPEAPETIRFAPAQTEALRSRFLDEARRRAADLPLAPEALAAMIDGFAAYNAVFSLRSSEYLAGLFDEMGFRVATLAIDPADTIGPQTSPGPTLAGGVAYLKLVAIKR